MTSARDLTNHLALLLRNEHGAMADFLLALAAFDRDKRWRELGHTSLFYFLHKELRLSKGAAQNRKTAAALIQAFPDVEAALRRGDLCLSTVNEVAKVLTPENCGDVLPRFFRLSRREAEDVVVTLRPAEVIPVREVVTAVRVARPQASAAQAAPAAAPPASATRTHSAFHLDEPTPAASMPVTAPQPLPPPRESAEPLDAHRARLHVTVSRRFLEKLEAAKDALGHAVPDGDAEKVLERGLDLLLAEHARCNGAVEKPRKTRAPAHPGTIPAAVKREVRLRAGDRCEWVRESGDRCEERRRLEYDHIQPVAHGGSSTLENVRLTCRGHNLLAARRVLGDAVMDRYVRPSRASLRGDGPAGASAIP